MFSVAGATPIEWTVLVCNCFSMPLYLVTILLLVKNRKVEPFNSPFFKLYISAGIADFLLNIWYYKLCIRIWGWIDWHPLFYNQNTALRWFFRMVTYTNWFNGVAQVNGVFNVAINRFWNIVYKEKGPWKSQTLKLVIFTQWITALVIVSPFFFLEYTVVKVNGTGGEILHSRPPMEFYSVYILVVGGGYFSTVAIIVGILYAIMFENLRKHNKQMRDGGATGTNGNTSAEIRLAVMGFVLFILLAIYCMEFAAYAFFTRSRNIQMMHLVNILFYQTGIIQTQINPWLLIICSKPTREIFLKLFGFQDNRVTPFKKSQIEKARGQKITIRHQNVCATEFHEM